MEQQDHFPVLRSILAPTALARLLEESYGLAVSRLELVKAVILDTYRVWSGDDRYILRIYPARRRSLKEIRAELEFLAHLDNQGISVSIPIATKTGARTVPLPAPEGVRHAALFTYAPGQRPGKDPETTRRFGIILARMHAVAETFPVTGARTPLDLAFLLDRPLANLAALPERRETWRTLRQIAAKIRPQLAALPTTAPHFGYCHGDFGGNNGHVSAGGKITLFDFDFCGPGWRVYDVATFLIGESAEVAAQFLDGYQAVRALTEEETQAIPRFQIAQSIWMLGTRASYLDEWGVIRLTDAFVERVVDGIRRNLD